MHLNFETRHRWRELARVASAIAGCPVEVVPGPLPCVSCRPPSKKFNSVQLRNSTFVPGKEVDRDADICHEISHLLYSDVVHTMLGPRLMLNALEDARISQPSINQWSGLRRHMDEGLRHLVSYALRERPLASTANILKIFRIGVCLRLALDDVPWDSIRLIIGPMPMEIAKELLPLALPALRAPTTQEVAKIAQQVFDAIIEAAKSVATRLGTSAAHTWIRSLAKEVRIAKDTPYAAVLVDLERREYPTYWCGPWYRGMAGGYRFPAKLLDWDESSEFTELALPNQTAIHELLCEADPLIEHSAVQSKQQRGRFRATSDLIIRASVGADRRIFERSYSDYSLLLLSLLGNIEVLILLDGHARYLDSEWTEVKTVAATLGRILKLAECPLSLIRSYYATRSKEWVEQTNPRTGAIRRYERWSNNIDIMIAQIQGLDEKWDQDSEQRLASLAKTGFNLPFAGYAELMTHKVSLPKPSARQRIVLCIGNAKEFNVPLFGAHVKEATSALRSPRSKTIYVHCGPALYDHDPYRRSIEAGVDMLIREQEFERQIVGILQGIVELCA